MFFSAASFEKKKSSWRREQCSREASRRGVEGSPGEVPSPASEREVDILPEFPRTSPEASDEGRRFDCQGREQKTVFMQEVAEAEERLKQLEAEESKPTPPSEPGVMELQRRIEELVRERDALRAPMQGVWCADGPPSMDAIPPMPSTDLQELQGWLSERNCELRNALEFGDTTTIAKLGELVGQGTSAMGSTLMSAVIDQAEAKRRCLAVGSGAQIPSVVGNRV